jgi:uncharacterized membrane protein YczE
MLDIIDHIEIGLVLMAIGLAIYIYCCFRA